MKLTDQLLRQAAAETWAAMAASLPDPADCAAQPSPRFYRRMAPLLRRQRHPVFYGALRQAAACFLALLVLGGGWLTVDRDARAAFFRWAREVYQTQIVYRFMGLPAEAGVYRPAWVPEGYAELDASDSTVVYYSETNGSLTFTFGPMQEGTSLYVIDTNKATLKHVEINGLPGELYLSTDPALRNALVWLDENNAMSFSISGFLNEADMLHMAESISLVNPTK